MRPLLLIANLVAALALAFGPVLPTTPTAQAATHASAKKKTTAKKKTVKQSAAQKSVKKTAKKTVRTTTKKTTAKAATSNTAAKERALSQRRDVANRLNTLKESLKANEARSEEAAQALKKADTAISNTNRKLRRLNDDRKEAQTRLKRLAADRVSVDRRRDEAAELVASIGRAQYLNLTQPVWQRLITGANPSELSRERAALRYLAREEGRAVEHLEARQNEIAQLTEETRSRTAELARITKEEEQSRRDLLKEKKEREAALTTLAAQIKTQQADITRLKKDEQRLGNLVANLDKKIAAEHEAQARKAAQEAARAEAAKKPVTPVRHAATGQFAKLKGRLTPPTDGTIIHKFGDKRGNGTWLGLQYQAKEGADVRAVGAGTVVFADWLRGYGNLIIVDHGNAYLSVYANNESLFKNVGETVAQGETISSVGRSGGGQTPGLYFELRYKGKPVNPSAWLKR